MASLIKFSNRTKDGSGRGNLFWGRANVDGAPFRGMLPPNFTEEEFEARAHRVADPDNRTFYTGSKEENKAYLDIMDAICNGWAQLIYVERWREPGDIHHYVYIEWVKYYMEDGAPAALPPVPPLGR